MKQVFYIKKGRRYLPVQEYDSDLMRAFPEGSHLLHCRPGLTSCVMRVDPDHAAVLAALRPLEEQMKASLLEALKPRLGAAYQPRPLTAKAVQLWEALKKEVGNDCPLHQESVSQIVHEVLETAQRLALQNQKAP